MTRGAGMTARQSILYLLSLLPALLAMKTKEISATLPLSIALYEFMFFKGPVKKRLIYLVPFLLTMLIIPYTFIGVDKPVGELMGDVSEVSKVQTEMPRLTYLLTEFRVVTTYLRLLVLPINQNLDYDYPVSHTFDWQVFLSALLHLSILGLAIYLIYRSRKRAELRLIAFGIFWFYLTFLPESSVIPIVDVIFEHRVYLPSVGVFMAVAGAVLFSRRLTPAALVILISVAAFSTVTYSRNTVWGSEISLWEDVVRKAPTKARGYNNLASVYQHKDLTERAIVYYQIALQLKPDYIDAYNNLSSAYMKKGLPDKAIECLQTALKLQLGNAETYYKLGNIYWSVGQLDNAIEHYIIALRLRPDYVSAHNNLGMVYMEKGMTGKSIEHFRFASELQPDNESTFLNLGTAYGTIGLADGAIESFQKALRLNPESVKAHYNIGLAYYNKGLFDKAIEYYITALRLRPTFKRQVQQQPLRAAFCSPDIFWACC